MLGAIEMRGEAEDRREMAEELDKRRGGGDGELRSWSRDADGLFCDDERAQQKQSSAKSPAPDKLVPIKGAPVRRIRR
jgi:hypothetical protein